jgi:hypothetical protein
MNSLIHNDYRQPVIASDTEYTQSRAFLALIEDVITTQEDIVFQARQSGDAQALSRARSSLWRLLTKRQGILDQLRAYSRQHER